jgi:hypothetical protein
LPTATIPDQSTQVAPTSAQPLDQGDLNSPVLVPPTAGPSPTPLPPEPDRTWAEQPFGDGKLTVSFFSTPAGRCVRFVASTAPDQPAEACSNDPRAVIVAVQGILSDSNGKTYTIIAGQTLTDAVTAVSLELDKGSFANVEVIDRGFLVILPGKRSTLHAIPVDNHGNLAGPNFVFR